MPLIGLIIFFGLFARTPIGGINISCGVFGFAFFTIGGR
jgi:hypothetical protein